LSRNGALFLLPFAPGVAPSLDLFGLVRRLKHFAILLILTLVGPFAWAQADLLVDLKTETQSMMARLELIMDPETKTIDISTYEVQNDTVGRTFLAALIAAAKRGVEVRLLIDNQIKYGNPALLAEMKNAGIQLRFYNPIGFRWADVLSPLQTFHRFNRRMHDKVFLVNSRQSVVGDKNYSEKFFRYSVHKNDRLTMLGKEFYVENAAAGAELRQYFEALWVDPMVTEPIIAGPVDPAEKMKVTEQISRHLVWVQEQIKRRSGAWKAGALPFDAVEVMHDRERINPDGTKAVDTTLAQILEQVKKAPPGSQILFENSYFVLFPELEAALKVAIDKGCEIHVVLNAPEVTDQRLIGEALLRDLPRMLEIGLNVSLNTASRRISHAKLVVIGKDVVINGSANVDPRSHRINSESSLLVRSSALVSRYWERFHQTKSLRQEVTMNIKACADVFSLKKYLPASPSPLSPKVWLLEAIRPQL
jgi:putative cardiolipin synthase